MGTQDSAQKAQIRALLRSHSPPPIHLASTLSTTSAELQRYENEIPRLRAQLARAEADYDALKQHYSDVHSLLAPIRRLPSEILVQIFEECEGPPQSDPNHVGPVMDPNSLEDQMAHLAQKPLLVVSQVCARWHEIVLGTPTFWDTIELDSTDLWLTKRRAKRALALLKVILIRSANIPLHFSIGIVDNGMDCTGALPVLVQHCERWKTARFYCRSADLEQLLSVRGKLPLLETLELEVHDSPYVEHPFEVAPKLRTLALGGRLLPHLAVVHLDKLHTFACLGQDRRRAPSSLSFMSHLPHEIKFSLQLYLDDDDNTGIDAHPTCSDISSFSMDTRDYFSPAHCVEAIGDIFTNLTLPRLRNLNFHSQEAPFSLIYWPHAAFMGLATRSLFQAHLQSLLLCDVVITEAELVEALAVLPLLQRLEISDHQTFQETGADHVLLTNSLFSALTLKPEPHTPRLVPLLQSLLCQSRLEFDDNVYLDFLVSRRRKVPSDPAPFVSRMYWLPGHGRNIDVDVAARLRELCIRKELACEFARASVW